MTKVLVMHFDGAFEANWSGRCF